MLHQSITSAQLVHFETSFENEKLPGLRRSQQEEEEEEAKEEEEVIPGDLLQMLWERKGASLT